MKWPSLSFVIPSLNCETYIERALLSILKQEYDGKLQIIVSDGGSTDGTVEILRKYPQVTWRSKPDKGPLDATLKALNFASGEIITLLPSDDFYLKDAFKKVIPPLMNNSEIAFVSGAIGYLDNKKRIFYPPTHKYTYTISNPSKYILREIAIPLQCTFIRKMVFDKIGLREEYPLTNDVDFLYRMLHFYQGIIIPEYIGVFQIHEGQQTRSNPSTWIESTRAIIERCEHDLEYSKIFTLSEKDKNELLLGIEMFWYNHIGDLEEQKKATSIALNILDHKDMHSKMLVDSANSVLTSHTNMYKKIARSVLNGSIYKKVQARIHSFLISRRVDIDWWKNS
jgi:glycosyltransferase involved in cell wall biosynthesis